MNITKLVSTFVAAAALAVSLSPSTASAATAECNPTIPSSGLSTSCGTVASTRRSTHTVTITNQGKRYVYTANLVVGGTAIARLLNQDGSPTRDNTFPTPGQICPFVLDQTASSGLVPSASCNVAFAFAGKSLRITVAN